MRIWSLPNPWLLVMSLWSFQVIFGNRKALVRFQKSCAAMSVLTLLLILAKGLFPDLLIQQNWAVILAMLPLNLLNSGFSLQRLCAFLNRGRPRRHPEERDERSLYETALSLPRPDAPSGVELCMVAQIG